MGKASKPIKDNKTIKDMQGYLEYNNERDYVLFILGITTGYRSQDLVDLRVRDIQKAIKDKEFCILEKKRVKNHTTKKLKGKPEPRKAVIRPKVSKILKNYIENKPGYDYVFKSQKGGHLTVDSYARILREAGKYFKIDNIAAHTPRKIYAYRLYLDSGKNIELVRKSLGHSTTLITERYLGIDRDMIDEYSRGLDDMLV